MLTLLGSVLDVAAKDGLVARNVARMVERPSQAKHEMRTWTAGEAAAFLEAVATERLSVAFQLSMYGLRRGEVLGLRWSDVDLEAKTITIRITRTLIAGTEVVEGEPKTERGKRTLPLDSALVAALRSLKARQARERLDQTEPHADQRPPPHRLPADRALVARDDDEVIRQAHRRKC